MSEKESADHLIYAIRDINEAHDRHAVSMSDTGAGGGAGDSNDNTSGGGSSDTTDTSDGSNSSDSSDSGN